MSTRTNDAGNWERRLAGDTSVPTHDGDPDYGFYRVPRGDGFDAVAYWCDKDDGGLRCRINGRDVSSQVGCEKWTWACERPISYELYTDVLAGKPWPDLHEAVTRSNQAPADDSLDALKDRIEDLSREADKITEVKSQSDADRAADLANKLGELQTTADDCRAAEKRPHDDAAKAVQTKWKPVIDAADAAKRRIKGVIAKFLTAKEAAERLAREEAAKAGAWVPQPEQQRASTTKAGTRGRAVALRTVKDATITDRAAVLAFFAGGQAMTEFLQAQAEKAVRAGVEVPGVTITERKVAA